MDQHYKHKIMGNKSYVGRLHGLFGSALDHRSLPPEFESERGHI